MQSSIYYREKDTYLIEKLEEKALRERKSASACLLTILEEYFEAENRIGAILNDMGLLDKEQLSLSLEKQKDEKMDRKIGEILLEENYIRQVDLDRALVIQKSSGENNDEKNK